MHRHIITSLLISEFFGALVFSGKPSCTKKVFDVTVLVGSTAFLPCYIQGEPLPTYEWRKVQDKKLRVLGLRFTPSDKGLIIYNVTNEDGGKYQVELKNKDVYYWTIKLHVKDTNVMKLDKFKRTKVNSHVHLSCGKRPAETKSKIKWVDYTGRDVSRQRYHIHANGSLLISDVSKFDTGQYTCKNTTIMNGGSLETSLSWYLDVQYEPQILITKQHVEVRKGFDVILPCISIGNPAPTIQWQFRNGTIIRDGPVFKTLDNGSLLITTSQKENALEYTCLSYNKIGRQVHRSTKLLVLVAPRFLGNPATHFLVTKGDNIELDCASFGIPKPRTTWNHRNASTLITEGRFSLQNVKMIDAGSYTCFVESKAGSLSRNFVVTIKGVPDIPTIFMAEIDDSRLILKWRANFDGGLRQHFEVWYRTEEESDYEWKVISINETFCNISVGNILGKSGKIYCSIRAQNSEGHTDFSHVINISSFKKTSKPETIKELCDLPLAPYKLKVDAGEDGFALNWKYLATPGRPIVSRFLVEYRNSSNTTEWESFSPKTRNVRSVSATAIGVSNEVLIPLTINDNKLTPLAFRVFAVTAGDVKSEANTIYMEGAFPFWNNVGSRRTSIDIIPPVVLGVIFLFFFIILTVSLYCFCRRKMKRSQARVGEKEDKEKSDLILETYSMEFDDESKLFGSKFNSDAPTLFHLSTCPALTLGKCSKKSPADAGSDEVYFLMEPNDKEVTTCTCNKTVKVDQPHQKEYGKKVEYKTSSSPTVSLTSEGEVSSVVPSEGFDDEEDYEISDIDKDYVAELDKVKVQVLKRFKFKDSYDQFCKPGQKGGTRTHISSAEKTEVDSNMETNGLNDDSSENSATESERRMKSKSIEDYDCDPKYYDMKANSKMEGCNSSSSDPDSISFVKSNNPTDYLDDYERSHSIREISYYSDNPSRMSPLFLSNQNYHPQAEAYPHYYSDNDNTVPTYRNKQPPTYNQAIIDIERICNRNEIADSEEMYDHLLRMEKQLGVQLGGSLESELNAATLPWNYRNPHSKNSSDTGYISDIQTCSGRERYSNREKSARCAQLLNEFKSSKPEDLQLMGNNLGSPEDIDGSVLDDIVTDLPTITPILKRTNSCSSNSTHNEWLV